MKREPGTLQTYVIQVDYLLVLFVLLTTGFGLLVLHGTIHSVPRFANLAHVQVRWWVLSLFVFAMALSVPYRWLKVLGWPLYVLASGALIALLIAARTGDDLGGLVHRAGGAASWFRVPLGPLSLRVQPAEFAKIAVVLVLAQWLAWRRDHLKSVWECVVPVLLTAVPVALICLQPDMGTAAIVLPLPFILLFIAGLRWRIVLIFVSLGLAVVAGGVYYLTTAEKVPGLRTYQLKRIRVFLVPVKQAVGPMLSPFRPPGVEQVLFGPQNAGQSPEPTGPEMDESTSPSRKPRRYDDPGKWQIQQAEMALGSGQLYGKGWGKGTQTGMGFLPEAHTDFIFSSLGEQFGLMGCIALFGLYLLIVWRVIQAAVVVSDHFAKYMVLGLLSVFLLHVLFNIGMTIRLLPVTGVPLPLMSYGGSFLASNYLIFGLIANVTMRR